MDSEENDRDEKIKSLEILYERIKQIIWTGKSEATQEDQEFEDSPLMRAGRRNAAIVAERPEMPGESEIGNLP